MRDHHQCRRTSKRAAQATIQGVRIQRCKARVEDHQLVVFGPGDSITVGAADTQPEAFPNLEVLLLGGLPINEPIAHHGPFLMNTREQILEAIEDFNAGRMGQIPAIPGR